MRPRFARVRRALSALLLAVPLAAALPPGDSRAQGPAPAAGAAEEDAVLALYRDGKLLTARTGAQAVLDRDPGSIAGQYVLGSVLREAEGSLPRSMAHLREARRLFALRYGPEARQPGEGPVARLGGEILFSLSRTAQSMEQYDLALDLLDEHDRTAPHKLTALHVWPLIKLRRYDEARAFAEEALASGDRTQDLTALNGLAVIAGESHQHREAYDVGKRLYEAAKGRAGAANLTVYAHNAALSALGVLRFDEAEALARAGAERIVGSNSNPWIVLAELYTGEGRADDTVAALREMQRWAAAAPPRNRDQSSAVIDATIALVLLAAGEPAAGLRFIDRAIGQPDRRAVTAAAPEQARGGHALLRRALLRLDAEAGAEHAAARGVGERALGVASALGERAQAWPDEERAIAVLSDEDLLGATLHPYSDGALEPCPTWLAGDLVGLLGPGVVSAALGRARAADTAHGMGETAPYYDALDAEIALARGDDALAQDLAGRTLDALPRAEALLRARVAAVGAEAAWRRGQRGPSLGLFERALALDPGVVRRLGLAVPARVEASGDAQAERAATFLGRSPRLRSAAGGFVVRVEGDARRLTACLLTPSAAKLACGQAVAAVGDAPGDLATRLADDFHHAAFAMRFSLTPTDLRSLDGSTTAAQGSAREALRGLLGDGGAHPAR